MINLTWAEKGKEKATEEKLIKRRGKEEQKSCKDITQTSKNETSRSVFQRLGRDSQPKNLSEVFRNYEASEEVEDKKNETPRWVDVRPPQPSYASDAKIKEKTVKPVIIKNVAQLWLRWYIVGRDGKPVKEMRASMIRRVQRQHKAHMNSLKVLTTSETSKN
ncbi:hypothetical protein ACFXTN_004086 [Malus domestica]